MNEKNNKIALDSINSIKDNIVFCENKIKLSRLIYKIGFITSIIFFVISIILFSLVFVYTKSNIIMIFSIITLVLGFIIIQIALASYMLKKYVYYPRLVNLLKIVDLINKEVKK